ncbi:MAG: hypothetical protein D6805_09735 [Planctomycetota bacterium]|nr:MAG: hypothetical protein D6805_09735 [Planctomycetota bacterium]
MYEIMWLILGILSVISAILVVSRINPVYSALYLMLFFASVSGLFAFLGASFVAVTQLFIYIGAIIVLFLFVIMMLNFEELKKLQRPPLFSPLKGLILSLALFGLLCVPIYFGLPSAHPRHLPADFGSAKWIARDMYIQYPFAIELASVLIIAALAGAFVIARIGKKAKNS